MSAASKALQMWSDIAVEEASRRVTVKWLKPHIRMLNGRWHIAISLSYSQAARHLPHVHAEYMRTMDYVSRLEARRLGFDA